MNGRLSLAPRIVGACLVAVVLATAAAFGQSKVTQGGVTEKQRRSLVKLAEPWPGAKTIARRKADAEKRRLFVSSEPLAFTLKADFKKVTGDRSPSSTTVYPATITAPGRDGQPVTVAVKIRNRGILRRNPRTCGFPPIRIEFPRDVKGASEEIKAARAALKRSVFAGSENLKLVTHCSGGSDFEQYVYREHLAYRVYNLVTPWSLRTRLARGTYVDAEGRTIASKPAFFIEEEGDLAKRMEARTAVLPRTSFADHDMDTLTMAALFQFLVGNTDYSVFALHNVFLVRTHDQKVHAVAYDFDVSGLVDPPYALPAKAFNLQSVKDRLYRGPCRTAEELEPLLARFRAKKNDILKLYADASELSRQSREDAKVFLDEFFDIVNDKGRIKRRFIDTCNKGVW
jgi:hypothetical protein